MSRSVGRLTMLIKHERERVNGKIVDDELHIR